MERAVVPASGRLRYKAGTAGAGEGRASVQSGAGRLTRWRGLDAIGVPQMAWEAEKPGSLILR